MALFIECCYTLLIIWEVELVMVLMEVLISDFPRVEDVAPGGCCDLHHNLFS